MRTSQTRLLCVHSGNVTTIWRRKGRLKQQGHLKKLYCAECGREHNHYELGEWDNPEEVLEYLREDGFDDYEPPNDSIDILFNEWVEES